MKKKSCVQKVLLLFAACMMLTFALGITVHAFDKTVSLGSWTKITGGKGDTSGYLRFTLAKDSDISISFRNCSSTTTEMSYGGTLNDYGTIEACIDGTGNTEQVLSESGLGSVLTNKTQEIKKREKGSHYLYFALENVVSVEVQITVTKQYEAADYSAKSMNRTLSASQLGKWISFSHGAGSSTGYLRFKLSKDSDVSVSVRNCTSVTEYSNGKNDNAYGTFRMYLDSEDSAQMIYESASGTVVSAHSETVRKLKAGSHYLYFDLNDIDAFEIKISVTKTYAKPKYSAKSMNRTLTAGQLGKWLSFSHGAGSSSGYLRFKLPKTSDVEISIRKCMPNSYYSGGNKYKYGEIEMHLDSTGSQQLLRESSYTGAVVSSYVKTVEKQSAGKHYLYFNFEEIDSFEIKIAVKKKYPAADYSARSMNRTLKAKELGKWISFSHGTGSTKGYLRFKLAKPSDISISVRNSSSTFSYSYGKKSFDSGNFTVYLDSKDNYSQRLCNGYGTGKMVSSSVNKKEALDAGSHYLYFEMSNVDSFEVKIAVTKTYKDGPATAVRMASKKTMSTYTKLSLDPTLVNPFEKLTGMKWSSSNKRVASVSSKGEVTAKKTGKAVITCRLKNGKTYKCRVTVKKNAASKRATFNDSHYSDCDIDWTSMSIKGNTLTMKCKAYNERIFKAQKYTYIDITVYTRDGKVLAAKTFKNVPLNLDAYGMRNLTFKFKLKTKNYDLRANGASIGFRYQYIYLT